MLFLWSRTRAFTASSLWADDSGSDDLRRRCFPALAVQTCHNSYLAFLTSITGGYTIRCRSTAQCLVVYNRPFAVYDHMVQNPPCWRANRPLGHPKQKNIKLSCFVLDVPVGGLLSSMADFVPCDRKLQRAHSAGRRTAILKRPQVSHWHVD